MSQQNYPTEQIHAAMAGDTVAMDQLAMHVRALATSAVGMDELDELLHDIYTAGQWRPTYEPESTP